MSQLPKNVHVSVIPNVVDARSGVVSYHIVFNSELDVKIPEEAAKDKDFTNKYIDYAVKQLMSNVRESIKEK